IALAGPLNLVHRAEKILNMMPDLMGDDIRLGEIARGLEFAFQLLEEVEVEIQVLITGAVERPHRSFAIAARRGSLAAVEDEFGWLIPDAGLLRKYLTPDIFRHFHHGPDELAILIGRLIYRVTRRTGLLCLLFGRESVAQLPRIDHANQRRHRSE